MVDSTFSDLDFGLPDEYDLPDFEMDWSGDTFGSRNLYSMNMDEAAPGLLDSKQLGFDQLEALFLNLPASPVINTVSLRVQNSEFSLSWPVSPQVLSSCF